METEPRTAIMARDLSQRRLRRMTMRVGAVAVGGVGVLGAVAAFTLPGQKPANGLAATDPDASAQSSAGTALTLAPRREGDDDGRAAPQLQPAQSAPAVSIFGPPRAVTGGSR